MLFAIFVILMPATIWLILHFMSRWENDSESDGPTEPVEVCAICQEEFPMTQLV